MEIYQLKTFVAVAAEGNLTRAADRVFTSPPAVSAQLKALEDELGVRLFDRNSRGMSLTSAGQHLLREAQRTIAAAQAMQAAAASIRGEARGAVRMGSVSDPVSLRLGEVFVRLAERHPLVALQLHQGVSVRTMQAVRRGELDCAYVLDVDEQHEGLEVVRLQPSEIVAVLPVEQARQSIPATLAELAQLPWVTTPPDCGLRWHLGQLFEAAGAGFPSGAMADTEGMVRSMVASGIGAGLMRRDQAEDAQRQGQGVIWQGWSGKTWLCWISSPGALKVPAVAAVREAVIDSWV
ncbi:MAG: LysR family transcriptional regulator [Rhodoferax sp.]|nr:LysR family transcriptional regulator [Rhodoferax sp.]MBP9929055.1 LysR family transcriptional regulator [Rhodoferax sp.]HQX58427.1 LysR family transcriptional regulator [Burkholderiaceae bacterium]